MEEIHNELILQISKLLDNITTPIVLPISTLKLYGLCRDPFTMPIGKWIRSLLELTGEREVLLAAAIVCRSLGISWDHGNLQNAVPCRVIIPYNRHRVFLSALILVDKFYTDDAYKVGAWAGRFRYWEARILHAMEMAILHRLNWHMAISPECFNAFLRFMCLSDAAIADLSLPTTFSTDDLV
eukprot:Rmarinus@m.6317